jgi:signal transduction histidine kinase
VLINAQICFESTEGKGTTFQICVPIKATATPLR